MKKIALFLTMVLLALTVTMPAYGFTPPVPMIPALVGYREGVGLQSITALGGNVLQYFPFISVAKVEVPANVFSLAMVAKDIDFIEPDYPVFATAQTVPWGIQHVNAPFVHSKGCKGNGIKVAVLDTGIRTNHVDLQVAGGFNTFGGSSYNDDNGHGTHVAGIIAALDNTEGVIGCAPKASLYSVKVLDSFGSGNYSNIIAGIEWASENDIRIINMSLGAGYGSTALERACEAAYNAGILLVAAAGNSGTTGGNNECIQYPAKYSTVMAVGSITSSNTRSNFSSTGSTLEIVAPGSNIYSTTYNGSYGTMSGTSMACPHVVGVAALVLCAKPSLTSAQLRNVLNLTAKDTWHDQWRYGNGLVDAKAAYNYVTTTIPAVEPLQVGIATNYGFYFYNDPIQITVTVVRQNGVPVANAVVNASIKTRNGNMRLLSTTTNAAGVANFTYIIMPFDGTGTYTINVNANYGQGAAVGAGTKNVDCFGYFLP